jgi:predicted RNase H-like nuclease (RuvC/YqgF family)
MKRVVVFFVLTQVMLAVSANSQDGTTPTNAAAALAAREGADERYQRMNADIQALQAANEALQNKLSQVSAELLELRNQQAQAASNSNVQDQLKALAEKITEVDRKRQEDKEAISEEIRKSMNGLEKSLTSSPAPSPSHVQPVANTEAANAAAEKGFLYVIQSGDKLALIVKSYNADFKSKGMKPITLKQAMDANPGVDWGRLKVGQKIVIPRPES